jgi:plasmid segregation protein ParM
VKAKTASIDLGYGWMKGKQGKLTWREPSVLGEVKPLFEESIRTTDVIYNDRYFVGDLALRQSDVRFASTKDSKAETWTSEILLETALGILSPNEPVNLVTGLPVDFYFTQKDAFVNMLEGINESGSYHLQVGRKRFTVNPRIQNHKIVAQPLGTAMDYLLTNDGQFENIEAAKKRLLVIDLGFYTLDLLILDAMDIGKASSSPPELGISTAYKLLRGYLKEKFGKAPDRHELDRYVIAGEYEGYDISPLIHKAFKALAAQIMLEIEGLNTKFHKYLITGGWASLIAEYLDLHDKEVFGQMANVRGYEKIGRRLWG